MSVYREIHTTVYSDKAAEVMSAALKYVSLGWLHTSRRTANTASHAEFNHHPNGELLVTFDDNRISSYRLVSYVRGNNDIKARQWLAWQIKDTLFREFEKNGDIKHKSWKRDCKSVSKILTEYANRDVTIQEAYCVYDILLNRKNIDKHFPKKLINALRGTENDPFKTEMEVQRRNEVANIKKEYEELINKANVNNYYSDLHKQMEKELEEIRARYKKESEDAIAKLSAERDAKLNELEVQFGALAAI